MRIALAGSSGTGKTTIANWIQAKYRLELNPVGSRSVSKAMGFDSPYDVDKAGRRAEFQTKLLLDKMSWEAGRDSFVTDRTTLDNLLYTALHDVYSVSNETIDLACKALNNYDYIIYFPMNSFCDIAGDPQRVSGVAYHRLYDAALFGFIEKFSKGSVITLEQSDLEERKTFLEGYIWGG